MPKGLCLVGMEGQQKSCDRSIGCERKFNFWLKPSWLEHVTAYFYPLIKGCQCEGSVNVKETHCQLAQFKLTTERLYV